VAGIRETQTVLHVRGNTIHVATYLDRADRISEPEHKVTVVARDHRRWGWPEQLKPRPGRLVAQPFNLGTATAVFLSLAYIRQDAPNATVVLYPADHFVYPEDRFLDTVRVAVEASQTLTQKLVLLGVAARGPELDYGWIQVGSDLGRFMGHHVRTAARFKEKPVFGREDEVMAAGSLWNTLILAANADFLWSLGFPEMMRRLERVSASIGEGDEESNLEALYQELSRHDFSSELLEVFPHKIAVVELNGVLWSDWGRSERIMESLEAIGRLPAFSLSLAATA
jgi:mannose-1-phosphate guanylyltransferase